MNEGDKVKILAGDKNKIGQVGVITGFIKDSGTVTGTNVGAIVKFQDPLIKEGHLFGAFKLEDLQETDEPTTVKDIDDVGIIVGDVKK